MYMQPAQLPRAPRRLPVFSRMFYKHNKNFIMQPAPLLFLQRRHRRILAVAA